MRSGKPPGSQCAVPNRRAGSRNPRRSGAFAGLFRNCSAWGAMVVEGRLPMPTRCSGQSKSIMEGTSSLRFTKK